MWAADPGHTAALSQAQAAASSTVPQTVFPSTAGASRTQPALRLLRLPLRILRPTVLRLPLCRPCCPGDPASLLAAAHQALPHVNLVYQPMLLGPIPGLVQNRQGRWCTDARRNHPGPCTGCPVTGCCGTRLLKRSTFLWQISNRCQRQDCPLPHCHLRQLKRPVFTALGTVISKQWRYQSSVTRNPAVSSGVKLNAEPGETGA